jgi:uncharacterized protein (UPF0333 family)
METVLILLGGMVLFAVIATIYVVKKEKHSSHSQS